MLQKYGQNFCNSARWGKASPGKPPQLQWTFQPERERRLLLYVLETKARRGDREYGRLYEGADGRNSRGTHGQDEVLGDDDEVLRLRFLGIPN